MVLGGKKLLTVSNFQKMKENKEKITMITAYDYPSAKQAERAGIDTILVGDSLGMTVLGYSSTTQVTLDDMIHHAKAVKRGAPNTFMVVDMPVMSYHSSLEQSIKNAVKLFQETDAQALKIEGASKEILELVRRLTDGGMPVVEHLGLSTQTVHVSAGCRERGTDAEVLKTEGDVKEILELVRRLTDGGIPVVEHLGLTPQTVNVLGDYRVQGNDEEKSKELLVDAKNLEAMGAVMVVYECIPKE